MENTHTPSSSFSHFNNICHNIKNYIFGQETKIATLNFSSGVNGLFEQSSPTEFITSKKSEKYHAHLYSLQENAMLRNYPGISKCIDTALKSEYISDDFKSSILLFKEHARENPMFSFLLHEHLKSDIDADRPPYKFGCNPDVETPVSELYNQHTSKEVLEQYNGKFIPLWFFDLMGIWFREASLETFKNIIDESPLVGVTALMTTEILLDSVSHVDFVLAQEFPRGDNIDNLVRYMGWSVIRNKESTAFLYKTKLVATGYYPVPLLKDDLCLRKRTSPIMTPLEFYESDNQEIKFDKDNVDKKIAKKASDEIKIINKAESRTMFVHVGNIRFAVIHWSQPKTDEGISFQHSYFQYLIDEGYIIGGDTNTSSKKIHLLVERMGSKLLGDDPTESTSDKKRTQVGTHGQYLRPDKAGIMVSDPKSHIMVPLFLTQYHQDTKIFSNGPVGTKQWPSDHKGKTSSFRGLKFT